jgi:hypothetical protein
MEQIKRLADLIKKWVLDVVQRVKTALGQV